MARLGHCLFWTSGRGEGEGGTRAACVCLCCGGLGSEVCVFVCGGLVGRVMRRDLEIGHVGAGGS